MTREPFLTALARNVVLAAVVGLLLLIGLPRHGTLVWDFLDVFTLAFCFAFIGYYVEVLLLALPGIATGIGRLIRVAGWFAGGLWCYVIGRFLWSIYGRDIAELPGLVFGGVFFVALQLALHGALAAAGKPSFYKD